MSLLQAEVTLPITSTCPFQSKQIDNMSFIHAQITTPIKTKYDKVKVDILRGLLDLRNLPSTGRKVELTMRLFQDENSQERWAALKTLQQQTTAVNLSQGPNSEQTSKLYCLRQNHTSYYKSLSTAQLVYHLHERALPVHGDQDDLVDRLKEYDWDGSEPYYSESDHKKKGGRTAILHNVTTMQQNFHYDGKGLHPSILEGLRILGWHYDVNKGLRLHFHQGSFDITVCGWPWPTSVGFFESRHTRIKLDKSLRKGLRSVQELGGQCLKTKSEMDVGKKPGNLLIVRAVIAVRQGKAGKFRVLGLQCEGMSTIGYVYAEDKYLEIYGELPNFHDVALTRKKCW